MPGVKAIIPALLTAAASAYAAPFQKRGMDQVISQCNHNFAYTFDDGPYKWNTELVNKFDSVGGKATFYVNGNNWSCIYSEANVQALRYAFEHGHQIASHTWSHPHITRLNEAQIDEEIQRLDEAFVKILGVKPKFFRPPFGDIDERTASYIQSKHGKTIILWDLDSGDTAAGANEQKSIDFYKGLAAQGPNSKHLTLSHEVWEYSIRAAEDGGVDALHIAGIPLLTTSQCLDMEPYEVVGAYGVRDDTWTCDGTWTARSSTTTASSTNTSSTNTSSATTSSATTSSTTSSATTSSTTSSATTSSTTSSITTSSTTSSITSSITSSTTTSSTTSSITTSSTTSSITSSITSSTTSSTTTSAGIAPSTTPTPSPTTPTPSPTTPACKLTYTSAPGDDCTKIEAKYNLVPGTLKAANSFITCNDIWAWTQLCIPDGPYNPTSNGTIMPTTTTTPAPACKETYASAPGDDCTKIEAKYNLVPGTLKAANQFVNCNDIWTRTPLCIPDGPYNPTATTPTPSASTTPPAQSTPTCKQTYTSVPNDTCSSIENIFNLVGGTIKAANPFLTCTDIWAWTSICIPDGPYNSGSSDVSCVTQNYQSLAGETCSSIETKFSLKTGSVSAKNPWVNCQDIWTNTNLSICVPNA